MAATQRHGEKCGGGAAARSTGGGAVARKMKKKSNGQRGAEEGKILRGASLRYLTTP